MTDVLTYEFENVPGDILRHLEGKYNIPQGIAPLFDSQDRLREKNNAKRHGLPVPDYVPLPACSSDEDCAEVPCELTDGQRREELSEAVKKVGMPCVLKTRRLGYDGHGQAVIREEKKTSRRRRNCSMFRAYWKPSCRSTMNAASSWSATARKPSISR